MSDFDFNQKIEYIDCTRDLNFEEARHWAYAHNTTFEEKISLRKIKKVTEEVEETDAEGNTIKKKIKVDKLFRYFFIGDNPQKPDENATFIPGTSKDE